ncbi:oxidoreductase [Escherichia coli]|nr:putative oxidoreductase [Escherichia coli TA280]KUU16521.1 oxidoreductase [Escherichia coli]KYU64271.1 oxidoreductase [Escherichia coli]KYU69945.1 oxidoreductase [Escherichia coli]PAR01306.1 oxidoreductase [Escherichia coli]
MLDLSSAKVRKSAEALRIIFHGTLIYSGKYTKARAEADCQI